MAPLLTVVAVVAGCAGVRELAYVQKNGITAEVAAGSIDDVESDLSSNADVVDSVASVPQIVEVSDLQGNRIVMNAVADEQSGEMVPVEELQEIVVVAKFRNVAERNGVVDLVFELIVPQELQHRRWQVRLAPKYRMLGDSLQTDKVFVTGGRFRRIQEWEYMMYNNYCRRIVPENERDMRFEMERQLGRFLRRRGIGREDSLGQVAALHYRRRLLEKINANMEEAQESIYREFVKDPYPMGGVRLDTVVADGLEGKVRYFYVQQIKTRPGLRKVEMVMEGGIFTNGKKLCSLAATSPITFYISSISSFADNTERYLKEVVYRDLHLNTRYNIVFRKGKWEIDPGLGNNARELNAIKLNIAAVLENSTYVMDSLVITACGSPDGKLHVNEKVSARRGDAIKGFVEQYVKFYRDSAQQSVWEINEDNSYSEESPPDNFDLRNIRVVSVAEDWERLHRLVEADTMLQVNSVGKLQLFNKMKTADPDAREEAIKNLPLYDYLYGELYPKLRRVDFEFKLRRKGMLKDTVHTTRLDTVYMAGVRALTDRDYKKAIEILRPYGCYNAAVAYVCLGYDRSALEILQKLPRSAKRDYMLAVVYGRLGDEEQAVQYFLNSVEQESSMRHRGNLDPEISALIKKYGIFRN